MSEETERATKKEEIELIAIKSIAIPLDLDTFILALKNGGKLVFKNKYQPKDNNYIHTLEYKGDSYITTTSYFVEKFFD
ncbi:MAG: hypothetical protein N3G19_02475 [Candidatus Pacearchaeota archaeon]|nr:hypothetical protein [Candidatus Pacearchaeota archaeon]